jgi:hypothetical protein
MELVEIVCEDGMGMALASSFSATAYVLVVLNLRAFFDLVF